MRTLLIFCQKEDGKEVGVQLFHFSEQRGNTVRDAAEWTSAVLNQRAMTSPPLNHLFGTTDFYPMCKKVENT